MIFQLKIAFTNGEYCININLPFDRTAPLPSNLSKNMQSSIQNNYQTESAVYFYCHS